MFKKIKVAERKTHESTLISLRTTLKRDEDALYVSKAFDKMCQHGLFIKLMNRLLPITLFLVLEDWFNCCSTFVDWLGSVSFSFKLTSGVR